MTVDFSLSRTELLFNDKTTLSVNPPSAPTSGLSYTWTIPTGFAVTEGSLTAASVTIEAPAENRSSVPITLTAKAVNYCDATHTATVTVKECYPSTYQPVINSTATFENGMFHAPNLQTVTFSTLPIESLRSGGTTTYAWNFGISPSPSRSFTPSSSPAAIDNITFVTKAPNYSADIYNLTLQIVADGYCTFTPVSRPVIVDAAKGALTGTVKIVEAVAPTADPANPVVWIANGRPVTLHAQYEAGSGEVLSELDLRYRWYWTDENSQNHELSGESVNGTLAFTPSSSVNKGLIRVEVLDRNGKTGAGRSYPYTVQTCGNSSLPGLHVNVNYQCGTKNQHSTAYVIDSTGKIDIYPIISISDNTWWFMENLRKENNAHITYVNVYGAYYPESAIEDLKKIDGTYCPKGWRIPNELEWNDLNKAVSPSNSGPEIFLKLATAEVATSTSLGDKAWNSTLIENTPGVNSIGFSAIPAGYFQGTAVYYYGQKAEFFMYNGQIQGYGLESSGPAAGTAYRLNMQSGRHYTARCVND
jgi:uncharacterized protein (TIGR02145 family)